MSFFWNQLVSEYTGSRTLLANKYIKGTHVGYSVWNCQLVLVLFVWFIKTNWRGAKDFPSNENCSAAYRLWYYFTWRFSSSEHPSLYIWNRCNQFWVSSDKNSSKTMCYYHMMGLLHTYEGKAVYYHIVIILICILLK